MTVLEYALEVGYGPQLDWLGYVIGMWLKSDFTRLELMQIETDVEYRSRLLDIARKIK